MNLFRMRGELVLVERKQILRIADDAFLSEVDNFVMDPLCKNETEDQKQRKVKKQAAEDLEKKMKKETVKKIYYGHSNGYRRDIYMKMNN